MPTEIYSHNPGRALAHYDLADELADRYGLTLRETHDGIWAYLADLDDAEISRRSATPELDRHNPNDRDRYHWIEITDEAADIVREAFAATYEPVEQPQ